MDKNFKPDSDSYCSHISGSSDTLVKKLKIAQVKRKIFSPVKNRQGDCQDLITLEDLMGPIKNQNLEGPMMTEDILDLDNESLHLATLNVHTSTSHILTVAMIHHYDTASASPREQDDHRSTERNHITPYMNFDEIIIQNEDTPVATNEELPTNSLNVMTVTIDGTIYLPDNFNTGTSEILCQGRSRKRLRNVEAWQRVVAKTARAKPKEGRYVHLF